jgi:rare lipoprotein A
MRRGLGLIVGVLTAAHCAVAACAPPQAGPGPNTSSKQSQDQAHALAAMPPVHPPPGHRVVEDGSGRKQAGEASVYARHFQGRRTASGRRFDHRGNVAASRTLPLGTVAKVTNTQTGKTAVVQVQDHGPYVDGRTIDVSRATAAQLGITRHDGVAPVVVAPVVVPQADGSRKVGAGAVPGPATAE